jgi:uncharacterized membrane protein
LTSLPDTNRGARPGRRLYIDWARGVAVLLMIEAHTLDAWTRAADRRSPGFRNATILGGFAAPLFLWLAGVGLVLSATRAMERDGGTRLAAIETICRRGLEIFALAFLFRLQAFIVSPGGQLVALLRVDILNVMGLGIVAGGLIWGVATIGTPSRPSSRTPSRPARLVIAYGLTAAVIATLTPVIRASPLVDRLPAWLGWYLRPAGDHTTFTVFPWAGFVFAGGACGAVIAAADGSGPGRTEGRLQVWLSLAGAALIGAGFYAATLPSIYRQVSFWTSSPTFFAIRVGVMMVALPALYVAARIAAGRGIRLRPLESFGRSSLFVYWIHVELVYGYASWLWRGRLPLWAMALAWAAFSALMYRVVVLRDRWRDRWDGTRGPDLTLQHKELSVSSAQ